jgi:CubicO group peptidase (beta-lactamase class C family)
MGFTWRMSGDKVSAAALTATFGLISALILPACGEILPSRLPSGSRLSSAGDPGCPEHKIPISMPWPLPVDIAGSLKSMNATVAALLGDGVPGAAVSARYLGQELLSSGVGVADKATGAAVIDTTLFRIGSVSKLFPVLLLYMYADPAIISRPISTFIPTFRVVNPFDGGQVTLGQLATHMSGMQRETPDGANTTGQVRVASRSSSGGFRDRWQHWSECCRMSCGSICA